jgi:alkaline phosphatase
MTVTAGALAGEIMDLPGGAAVGNIQAKALELWNLNVSADVAQKVLDMTGLQEGQDGYTVSFDYALARVLSEEYTAIGWTSHGHNAGDVPVWAYGPGAPSGLLDNTELADLVADAFGLNMASLNELLFVDLDEVYSNWTLDETDPANPVAQIAGTWASAELPCSKDLLIVNTPWGTLTFNLPGVVVHAPMTDRVYVPRRATRILRLFGIR